METMSKIDLEKRILKMATSLNLKCFGEYRKYIQQGLSTEEILNEILSEELGIKESNRYKLRMRNAGFPVIKRLDTYEFDESRLPNLKKDVVMDLAKCDFIKNKTNVIAVGNCGTGKSHLIIALAIEAICKGYTVKFKRASDLVNQMSEAQENKTLSKYLKSLNACDALLIDEIGYLTYDIQSANLLFQVFAARYEVKSTIVTTNLEFSKWVKFLGNDENMTSALVERLLDKSTVLNMNGKGYRIK